MDEPTTAQDRESNQQQANNLGSIETQITFVVGQAEVSLGQLRELHEGSLIENAVTSYFPNVRAQVNGRTIAEGEWVEIDGQVGFRVTKLLV